jgi:transposase
MVEAVRLARPMRAVARQFAVSLDTVQRWVHRAADQQLDRVEWENRPDGCRPAANRVTRETEEWVLRLRRDLQERSPLGEYGAAAIYRELGEQGYAHVPSVRTIGRVLERRGALDARRRRRWPAPPRGWYLPEVAGWEAELDSLDVVTGLVIRGGTDVDVLTAISLHGGLPAAWPHRMITAKIVVEALLGHWQAVGLPAYVQFDNDPRFRGSPKHPDSIGRVMRVCLSVGVVPVFAPPWELGFQAAIENFNGRWQRAVWTRFEHVSLVDLHMRSAQFIAALRRRTVMRQDAAPPRRPFVPPGIVDLQRRPQGRMIFLCRTTDRGEAQVLGRPYLVAPTWVHRLVRAELDLTAERLDFYALRRREPSHQPLLQTVSYHRSYKRFYE